MYHTSANSLNIQANKHERYRKYGLGFPGLVSGTEQLSVDDHVALSPRSDHDSASSVGSSEGRAPTFTESPPPSEIAVEEGGSKSTSRASSAEHSPPSLEVSIHRVDQCIISNAEVVSSRSNCSPRNLTDNPRTGTNSITTESTRLWFQKAGPMIPRTLSLSAAVCPRMSIVYHRVHYRSWL